jgi:hypothetical protein
MSRNLLQFHDFFSHGRPLSNGKLVFLDQTTQEPLAVYPSPTSETSYGSEVLLSDVGSLLGLVWLDSNHTYSMEIYDAEGSLIDTWNNLLNISVGSNPNEVTNSNDQDISALNQVGSDNQIKYIQGYYTPFDGGGGIFMWDSAETTQADGGTIFKPSSLSASNPGRWRRVFSTPYIISAWFGAIPRLDDQGAYIDLQPDFTRINSYMSRSDSVNDLYIYHSSKGIGSQHNIKSNLNLSNVTKLTFVRNAKFVLDDGKMIALPNADIEGRPVSHFESTGSLSQITFKNDVELRWSWIENMYNDSLYSAESNNAYIISKLPDYTSLIIDKDLVIRTEYNSSDRTNTIEKPYMKFHVVGSNTSFEEQGSRSPQTGYTYFTIGEYTADHTGSIDGIGSAKSASYPFASKGLDRSSNYAPNESAYQDAIGYNTVLYWDGGDDTEWPQLLQPYAQYGLNNFIVEKKFSPSNIFYCGNLQSNGFCNQNVIGNIITLQQYQNSTEATLAWIKGRENVGDPVKNKSNWLFCNGGTIKLDASKIPAGVTIAYDEAVIESDIGTKDKPLNYLGLHQSSVSGNYKVWATTISLEASVIGDIGDDSFEMDSFHANNKSSFGNLNTVNTVDFDGVTGIKIQNISGNANIRNCSFNYTGCVGANNIFVNNSDISNFQQYGPTGEAPTDIYITNNRLGSESSIRTNDNTYLTAECHNIFIQNNSGIPDTNKTQWLIPQLSNGADATSITQNDGWVSSMDYRGSIGKWWGWYGDSPGNLDVTGVKMHRSSSTSNDWQIDSMSVKCKLDSWNDTSWHTFSFVTDWGNLVSGSYDGQYWNFTSNNNEGSTSLKFSWSNDQYYFGIWQFKVLGINDGATQIQMDCNNADILILGENRIGSNTGTLSKKAYACISLDLSDTWTDMFALGATNAVLGFNDSSDFNGWSQYGSIYETVSSGYAATGKFVKGTLSWNQGSSTGPRKRHTGYFKMDENGIITFSGGTFYRAKFICDGINPYN